MQPELMNCPFCNGPAVNVAGEYISCGAPAFLTCAGRSVRADVEDWNTRATPTPPIEGRDADVERVALAILADLKRQATVQQDVYCDHEPLSGATDVSMTIIVHELARAALQALGERP